jgi:hypothetical protein
MSIIDYSKYNYANIVDINTIKHGDKILLINFVENTKKLTLLRMSVYVELSTMVL